MKIAKTIIPAAGLGTRFLPYTKAVPKEMLPLLNKPAIHYTVEECIRSNINNIFMVINKDRSAIPQYFEPSNELRALLKDLNKEDLVSEVEKLIRRATFAYIYQPEPFGLGHAILTARDLIDPKEYFGILLPDDIIINKQAALAQLMQIAEHEKASVIAVQEVPTECLPSYGVISIKKQMTPRLYRIEDIVEKPKTYDAPSDLAVIGRYVLSGKIFDILAEKEQDADEELQLTDAISQLIKNGEKVYAYKIQGTRFDIGTPVGWLKAQFALALQDPEYAHHMKEFLSGAETMNSFKVNQSKNILHRV